MALDLSSLPPPADPLPPPPSLLRWSVVFLACALAGIIVMLLSWPKHLPTGTPLFLIAVIGVPLAAASVIVFARFWIHAGVERRARSWDAVRNAHVSGVYASESRPIALLASALRFSKDDEENAVSLLASGGLLLKPRATPDKAGVAQARWLDAPPFMLGQKPADYDAKRQHAVLVDLVDELIQASADHISQLPAKLPLLVKLHIAAPSLNESAEAIFRSKWKRLELREADIAVEPAAPGLMALDKWLDAPAGEARDHATLLVMIQLHDLVSEQPPKGSAEAGVALLMVPEDVARRHHLVAAAHIHRPRQGALAALSETLKFALQWGASNAGAIRHLWHSGFDTVGQRALLGAMRADGIALMAEQEVSGEHDLDQAIGNCGVAAGWLALACACDAAQSFGGPQLVARYEGRHALLNVVQPVDRPSSHASL